MSASIPGISGGRAVAGPPCSMPQISPASFSHCDRAETGVLFGGTKGPNCPSPVGTSFRPAAGKHPGKGIPMQSGPVTRVHFFWYFSFGHTKKSTSVLHRRTPFGSPPRVEYHHNLSVDALARVHPTLCRHASSLNTIQKSAQHLVLLQSCGGHAVVHITYAATRRRRQSRACAPAYPAKQDAPPG